MNQFSISHDNKIINFKNNFIFRFFILKLLITESYQ